MLSTNLLIKMKNLQRGSYDIDLEIMKEMEMIGKDYYISENIPHKAVFNAARSELGISISPFSQNTDYAFNLVNRFKDIEVDMIERIKENSSWNVHISRKIGESLIFSFAEESSISLAIIKALATSLLEGESEENVPS